MVKRFIYNKKVAPYVFILPFIIIFLVFFISPMARTIVMSFQSVLPGITEWVGFDNYSRLLGDKVFLKAVMNSMKYMIWTLILLIPIPMLLATVLNSKFAKGREFFKSALYLPALTSVVVAGTIFRLEFSELDGANAVQKFIYITVPQLKPTIVYVLTISIYAGLAMFTESYMIWGGNSSPKNIGLTIVGYLYRQGIEKNAMGYASAVGIILFIIAMTINMIQLKMNGTFSKEE